MLGNEVVNGKRTMLCISKSMEGTEHHEPRYWRDNFKFRLVVRQYGGCKESERDDDVFHTDVCFMNLHVQNHEPDKKLLDTLEGAARNRLATQRWTCHNAINVLQWDQQKTHMNAENSA